MPDLFTSADVGQDLFGPQDVAGPAKHKSALPSFLPEGRDAAIDAMISGEVSHEQLYKNTMDTLEDVYGKGKIRIAQEMHEDDTMSPSVIGYGTEGQTIQVPEALADLQWGVQERLKASASKQPPEGFGTRAAAGAKMSTAGVINYVKEQYPDAQVHPEVDDVGNYTGNVIIQEQGKPPRYLRDPGGAGAEIADIADVSGDVLEGAIGTAGAMLGSAGGPKGVVAGAVGGAALGNVARQGLSASLPGSDELSLGERAMHVGTAAAAGLAGEGVGAVAAPAIRAGARGVAQGGRRIAGALGARGAGRTAAAGSAAREIGSEAGEQAAGSPAGKTVRSMFEEGLEIQNAFKDMGEDLSLSAGQLTGSKLALGRERTLSQLAETTDKVAAEQLNRLLSTGRVADGIVNRIAANPDRLGNADVGQRAVQAINAHVKALIKTRSEFATPLYDAAEEAAVGARISVFHTRGALEQALEKNKFSPTEVAAQLSTLLGKIDAAVADKSGLTISNMQNLRSLIGQTARGGGDDIIEGMTKGNQKRIARNLLGAIDEDLSNAALSGGNEVEFLRRANRAWRAHSKGIDNASGSKIIRRLLKMGAEENDEGIVKKIGTLSDRQVRGLFRTLDAADAEVAADLRAQIIKNVYASGGYRSAATKAGRDIMSMTGQQVPIPGRLKAAIAKNADLIGNTLAGNSKARMDIKYLVGGLDRLGLGPGWAGSDTAPKLFMAEMARATKGGPAGLVTKLTEAVKDAAVHRLANPADMAQALSTPEGINMVKAMIRPAMMKRKPTPKILRASLAAFTKFEIMSNFDATPKRARVTLGEPEED